jgi:drug/metabolite transporter (DMT)-like permease
MLRSRAAGFFLLLLSSLSMSVVSMLVKLVSRLGVPPGQTTFARFAVGLVLMAGYVAAARHPVKSGNMKDLVLRGLYTSGAVIFLFYGVAYGTMTNSFILLHTRPVWIVLLAYPLIGEAPRRRDFLGVALALAGVALIIRPVPALFQPADLFGLAAGVCSALALLTVRKLRRTEGAITINFYLMLVGAAASAPLLASGAVAPEASALWLLLGIGVLATASQLILNFSYRAVDAPTGSIVGSTAVVFAAGIGFFYLKEPMDFYTICGIALVLAANTIVSFSKK